MRSLNPKIMMVKPSDKSYASLINKPLQERSGKGYATALKEVFGMEVAWDIKEEEHAKAIVIKPIDKDSGYWIRIHPVERKKIQAELQARYRWSEDERYVNITSKSLWFLEESAALLNTIVR